jgi:MFS family permease
MEVSAPTMIDLKYRLHTRYEKLASAIGAGGIGTFPGCIVGGFLVDRFSSYSHFTLAMALNLAAVSVVLIPWVPNVYYLWILSFMTGFGLAIHNSGK